jgi:hypothetical protein
MFPRRTSSRAVLVLALLAPTVAAQPPEEATPKAKATPATCPKCGWRMPAVTPGRLIVVSRTADLERALATARPNTTIILRDGTYRLVHYLDITTPGLVIRGQTSDPKRVAIVGKGMDDPIGVALSVSAPGVVLADFTVGRVKNHGVQVRGETGADKVVLHNLRIIDTGEQFLKGSMSKDGRGPNDGLVSCCEFSYTVSGPSNYTNGVDVLGGARWVVRSNIFLRIRGPESGGWSCGPTILMWGGCHDSLVEGNLLVDCFRGIALGLIDHTPKKEPPDHQGGVIRRNVVCNLNTWCDEAIEADDCPGVVIEHNTVLSEGKVNWSISARFSRTTATIRNNLTNHPILARDGGTYTQEGNVTTAKRDWFIDPAHGDLLLIDAGVVIPGDRTPFNGKAPDAGAFEYPRRP